MILLLDKNKDFWDKLIPNQKKDIQSGINDLKAGRKNHFLLLWQNISKPHDLTVKC